MKKIIFIFMSMVMILSIFTGCGNTDKVDNNVDTSSESSEYLSELSKLIPDPYDYFSSGKIYISTNKDNFYSFNVEKVKDGEYEKFTNKCIELGFSDISYNSSSRFGGYSKNKKYFVYLEYNKKKNTIYLCLKQVDKK